MPWRRAVRLEIDVNRLPSLLREHPLSNRTCRQQDHPARGQHPPHLSLQTGPILLSNCDIRTAPLPLSWTAPAKSNVNSNGTILSKSQMQRRRVKVNHSTDRILLLRATSLRTLMHQNRFAGKQKSSRLLVTGPIIAPKLVFRQYRPL